MADVTQIMVENGKTDQKVERKLHMVFVNVSDTPDSPEWELQGRGVEDASVEYNMDVEQTSDILGRSDTTISAAKPQMNFDPNTLRVGQKLNSKLVDILRRGATSEMGTFHVLIVYMFLSESGTGPYEADQYANCSIVPTSMGGSDYVGLPFDLYLSGDRTAGTATITPGSGTTLPTATFTAATSGGGGGGQQGGVLMAEQIVLDLGVKTYEIKDPDGTVTGTVRFNPADPGFAGRWQQAEAKIEGYRQRINEMQASGVPEIDQWPLLMEASDAIKNTFDYAFGAPVSQVFFGGYSAFALTANGHTVLENVLEGVAPVIEKALKSAAKKAQKRMAGHTAPYQGTTKGLAPGQAAAPAAQP